MNKKRVVTLLVYRTGKCYTPTDTSVAQKIHFSASIQSLRKRKFNNNLSERTKGLRNHILKILTDKVVSSIRMKFKAVRIWVDFLKLHRIFFHSKWLFTWHNLNKIWRYQIFIKFFLSWNLYFLTFLAFLMSKLQFLYELSSTR